MDQHDGGYGYPPYEEDPRASGQGSGAPRGYQHDDPAAYGTDSAQQYDPNAAYDPAYGGQTGYADGSYGAQQAPGGYADPENPYAPRPIDPNYAYQYPQDNAYYGNPQGHYSEQPPAGAYPQQPPADPYAQQPSEDAYAPRGNTGRIYNNPDSAYATRLQMTDYSQRSATGRTTVPRASDGYGYTGRSSTARTQMPRDAEEYIPRGQTARTRMPEDEYAYADRLDSARIRRPQSDERYERGADDEDEGYERPRSGKKKRTKFGKFMHALGLYLAQLPSQTLIVVGGIFAVVLVTVVLLAVLLPKSDRADQTNEDGQISLTDVTITPSLVPTDTPTPTEAASPSAEIQTLTDNIKLNMTSDLMPDIQARLVELGYMEEPEGGYTNKYGPATRTAIRLFQVKNITDYHDWDGIIGQDTYNLLMSDQAKSYYLARGDGDDRTKAITKLVEDVTKLQNRLIELGYLTGGATGLYGATTVQAVQTFQQYHGLDNDGIAGQETLNLIYTDAAMTATAGKASYAARTPSPSTSAGVTTTNPSTSPSTNP